MAENTIYGFNATNADRLLGLIRQSGSQDQIGNTDTRQHALLAVATTGVPGRVGTSLGNADVAVKFVDWSGANLVIQDAAHTVKAHNLAADAVATGAYIIVHQVNTFWIVIWEECPE